MKKLTLLLFSTALLLLNACGSKVPFKEQEPLENSALVYVYQPLNISADENANISDYNIRFNGRQVMERISSNEYMVFNVKPEKVDVSVVRKQIEEKVIRLDLQVGEIYYLEILDNLEGNAFDFVQVDKKRAYPQLAKTGLAGSSVENVENIINVFSDEPKKEPALVPTHRTTSKMDEIQKAFDMKEKGMLSEEEFNTLKAEILAK